ncbi:MAG: PEP-CTERM sorting domain-containing protein, partial [Planctomycetales bacterium]|nr:PEP-CTERM sorting domain-containing protein [Planctomycetales bacterium]
VPGDVNGDGVANMDDFPPIRDHFFQSVTGRAEGDLTLDGFVNFADFRQWKDNAVGVGVSSVPEPAMGSLLSIGMLALGMVRRRK